MSPAERGKATRRRHIPLPLTRTPLPVQVYAHAGAVLEGRIYIACGCRGLTYLKETYCFHPGANTWSACAQGPVERAWHAMAALDGRIYVIGGSNDEFRYRRDVLTVRG